MKLSRHCEERSDEAIQRGAYTGLLRGARNDAAVLNFVIFARSEDDAFLGSTRKLVELSINVFQSK